MALEFLAPFCVRMCAKQRTHLSIDTSMAKCGLSEALQLSKNNENLLGTFAALRRLYIPLSRQG